jgi:hypothetical protein
MSTAAKHNEFIEDTDKLEKNILSIRPVDIDSYETAVRYLFSTYRTKWCRPTQKNDDEKVIIEREKLSQLYDNLKKSVYYNGTTYNINMNSIVITTTSLKEKLKDILKSEKRTQAELQENQYQKGHILLQLKRLTSTKKGFVLALEKVISYGYACKLIRFYNSCERYYNLRYTTLPFRNIVDNMDALEELMAKEYQFWNPQAAVTQQSPQ